MSSSPPLLDSVAEGIARLVLNRPKRLNALDGPLIAALEEKLRGLAKQEEVRVLILSGHRRAFCFGADLEGLPPGEERTATLESLLPRFQTAIVRLSRFPVPTIAAMAGFATGAGLDLALACDLRLAAAGTRLGVAFTKMGLVPDGGGTFHLPRLVGLARTFELLYTEKAITAEAAEAMGLINRVVPSGDLEEETLALARSIAALPTGALRAAKRLVLGNLQADLEGALAAEAMEQAERFGSEDFRRALDRLTSSRRGP